MPKGDGEGCNRNKDQKENKSLGWLFQSTFFGFILTVLGFMIFFLNLFSYGSFEMENINPLEISFAGSVLGLLGLTIIITCCIIASVKAKDLN